MTNNRSQFWRHTTTFLIVLFLPAQAPPSVMASDTYVLKPGEFRFERGKVGDDRAFVENFIRKKIPVWDNETLEELLAKFDPPFDRMPPEDQYYARLDLNGDKIKELLVRIEHPYTCGSVGCWTFIFQKTDGRWIVLGKFNTGEYGGTDGTRHDGWLAIYSFNMCAIWNGRYYKPYNRHKTMDHVFASCILD